MKPVVSLTDRQRGIVARTITDFQIVKSETGVQIRFRAFRAFAPNALDGRRASLYLNERLEACKDIKGQIVVSGDIQAVASTAPRGTWFTYEFLPTGPGIEGVHFDGEMNQWSNIAAVIVNLGTEVLHLRNDFTSWRRTGRQA